MEGYTIIVPVFNGGRRLKNLLDSLDSLDDPLPASGEILFVDDGSPDDSWKIICALSRPSSDQKAAVAGIRLKKNRGQQSALLAGIAARRGGNIITMDDDLSHPAGSIPAVLTALDDPISPVDMAYVSPPRRPGPPLRRLASTLHQLHMSLLTLSSPAIRVGSYRGMSADLCGRILQLPMAYPYLSAMALALRPAPRTAMLPSVDWPVGAGGRFSPGRLIALEWNLALHHGWPARLWRRFRDTQQRSVGETASRWISGSTP